MPDNLKFDESFIKECVLYDILNWKTLETSYKDICKLIGGNSISRSDHQEIFNEFFKETRNSDCTKRIIEKVFKKRPLSLFIKYRIQQDVIFKFSIELSYKIQCEIIGIIDYPEFDYWYYRIYNGDKDLDYDWTKGPKPLTFSELPTDVVRTIIKDWNFKDQYKLRKVSRDLRNLIDNTKPPLKTFKLAIQISESFDESNNLIKYHRSFVSVATYGDGIIEHDYLHVSIEKMCNILAAVVKNPKLCLDTLTILLPGYRNTNKTICEVITSLTHQLSVKVLKIVGCFEDEIEKIVTCCKPGILEHMSLHSTKIPCEQVIYSKLFESEQWKLAHEVFVYSLISCDLHNLYHLKSFYICRQTLSKDDLLKLRDAVSKSVKFEWCQIAFYVGPSEIEIQEHLGLKTRVYNHIEYVVYEIPNSKDTLKFIFSYSRTLHCHLLIIRLDL